MTYGEDPKMAFTFLFVFLLFAFGIGIKYAFGETGINIAIIITIILLLWASNDDGSGKYKIPKSAARLIKMTKQERTRKANRAATIGCIAGLLVFLSVFVPCFLADKADYEKALIESKVTGKEMDPPYWRTIICVITPFLIGASMLVATGVGEKIDQYAWHRPWE